MKSSSYSQRRIALSAVDILHELMGEIHAGRMIAVLAERPPDMFETKYPGLVTRIGEGAVFLALSKFADLWDHQILPLLGKEAPTRGYHLRREIKEKRIMEFRSLFVAHYSDRKENPRPGFEKFAKLINAQGFYDAQNLGLWTKGVLETIGEIADAIYLQFGPEKKTVAP